MAQNNICFTVKLQIITWFHYNTPRHKITDILKVVNITKAPNYLFKLSSVLLKHVETKCNFLLHIIPTRHTIHRS